MAEYVIKRKLFSERKLLSVTLLRKKTKAFGLGDGIGGAVQGIGQGVGNAVGAVGQAAGQAVGAAVDTTKQVAGGAMDTAGQVAQTGIGKLAGRIGAAMAGSAFGPLGTIAGFMLGGKATSAAGKALSNAGQNLQDS